MSAVVGREQVAQVVARVADEVAQQLVLGQLDVLERVGREEAVLADHERGLDRLRGAPGDGAQVGRLLGVPGEHDPPAGVGDAHHVVVAGVDVQGLAGQRAGADVEDDGQALAADDVQDLLHQDEALAGGEVGRPARRSARRPRPPRRSSARDSGSRNRSWVPHRFGRPSATAAWKTAAIVVRRGDRVGAGDLADPGLDVGDGLGPVDDGRDARIGRRRGGSAGGPGRSGKGRSGHARSVASSRRPRMGRCSRSRGPFGPRGEGPAGGLDRGSWSGKQRRGRVEGRVREVAAAIG